MKLLWTAKARRELAGIVSYIWREDPAAARRMRSRIETTAAYLGSQPFVGRIGSIAGTREAIPHPSYRIINQIVDDTVCLLSVVHTSRLWPPL
ncbi:MAG: type II toxin-antitoxin system RelE/ParE family toxin, partial [Rhizobiaceae bacterium]|nr:type II toxin-antitoxin system RelE/ParE family toxin [Rhizobiaceae bacterium]